MIKTILKAFFIVIGFGFLGIIIQGCCKTVFKISSHSEMYAENDINYPIIKLDTVSSEFILLVRFKQDIVGLKNAFNLINSSYALSCAESYKNHLIQESFTLTVDMPFVHNGDTISIGTNLLNLPYLESTFLVNYGTIDIKFNKAFMENSQFQTSYYKFVINGNTSDGIQLRDSLNLYFNL